MRLLIRLVILLTASGLGLVVGCSQEPTAPKAAMSNLPTPPSSPPAVVTYLLDCWRDRSTIDYPPILTSDYRFEFASGDSSGTYYFSTPWSRADEESCATHIFASGTRSQPPATSIAISFIGAPTDSADPRPGMNPKWHRLVTMTASVRIYFADGYFDVSGPSQFFVVRGDSAEIPADLIAKGVKPDATRWWLERWVDGTFQYYNAVPAKPRVPSARTEAITGTSWGSVKALYR